MPMLTAAQVTKWYLYGQDAIPANFVDETLIRPPVTGATALSLTQDLPTYMTQGPGRFATGSAFGEVTNFFARVDGAGGNPNNPYVFDIPVGVYDQATIAPYVDWVGQVRSIGFSNWQYDDGASDYGERTYIWGTVAFEIDDTARFVVTADGQRYIDNFKVKPFLNPDKLENFDFTAGDLTADRGRILEATIDPHIGRTLNLPFTESWLRHQIQ